MGRTPLESHSEKHGDLAKGGVPRGDCGADGNKNVLSSDLIPQSRAFQHGLKESLRARDTESDVTFPKFRDERPQFVCRRRINSPRGFSVVKKESERIWSSSDERARAGGEVFNVVEDERRFESIDERARHGPRVWVTGDIIVAVEPRHQAENGFTRTTRIAGE